MIKDLKNNLWGDPINPGKIRKLFRKLIHKSDFITMIYLRIRGRKPLNYSKWIEEIETPLINSINFKKEISELKYKPKISILIAVYSVNPILLKKAIRSIQNQYYKNWELCIHVDNPPKFKKENINYLKKISEEDKRIKYTVGQKRQHISLSTNAAAKLASGEYIALMDNDDEIPPYALFFFVQAINKNPNLKFIYSDEDKFSVENNEFDGKRKEPHFRTDWDSEKLLHVMYPTHLALYKKSLFNEVNGLRKGYEGSQDYDLILRTSEKITSEEIKHIPLILYHWRKIPGSTAVQASDKPYAIKASSRSVTDTIKRRKLNAKYSKGFLPLTHRIKYKVKNDNFVSIIIQSLNPKDVKISIDILNNKSSFLNFEIYVNKLLRNKLKNSTNKIKYYDFDDKTGFNYVVKTVKSKTTLHHILFINSITDVVDENWLKSLIQFSQKDKIGAVGGLILNKRGKIMNAGYYLGKDKNSSFLISPGFNKHHKMPGYLGTLKVPHKISALPINFMLVKKHLFDSLNGFDYKNFPKHFDIDFCLRLINKKYKNIFTPYSRIYSDFPNERQEEIPNQLPDYWEELIFHDPHYNPNLTREKTNFGLRFNKKYLNEFYKNKLKK